MAVNEQGPLLVVTRLARDPSVGLINRAAATAAKLGLRVIALCPIGSAVSPISQADAPPSASVDDIEDLAQRHVEKVAIALELRGITADRRVEACESDLAGTIEVATAVDASIVMVAASHYADWTESQAEGRDLERLEIPLWVQNGRSMEDSVEGIVMGALQFSTDSTKTDTVDETVALRAKRLADRLGVDVHFIHTIALEPAMHRALELITASDVVDTNLRQTEADCVARAHTTAARWNMPLEHVHVTRGEFHKEIERLDESMNVAVVVLGNNHRSFLARVFSSRTKQALAGKLRADILIAGRWI